MSGTRAGGVKASETNRRKYGSDFYREIGRKGGRKLNPNKGFASMSSERVSEIGRKGGKISKRGKALR